MAVREVTPRLLMLVLLMGIVTSCYGANNDNPELIRTVQERLDVLSGHWNSGNAAELLEDAGDHMQVMPPGRGLVKTKEELAVMYEAYIKVYDRVSITCVSAKQLCDGYIVEENTYVMWSSTGDRQAQHGESVFLWQIEDGKLKCEWAIWSPDEPETLAYAADTTSSS